MLRSSVFGLMSTALGRTSEGIAGVDKGGKESGGFIIVIVLEIM